MLPTSNMVVDMRHTKLNAEEAAILAGEVEKPSWASRNEGIHERVSFEDTIWGFELAGGSYYKTPLRVVYVKPGSRADQACIKLGDTVLRINDIDTSTLTLQEAHELILESGIHLRIAVTSPDDDEDAYYCYKDPLAHENAIPDDVLRAMEAERIRKAIASAAKSCNLQWPWVRRKMIIYRESNCFLVQSKYEDKHREKYPELPHIRYIDDITEVLDKRKKFDKEKEEAEKAKKEAEEAEKARLEAEAAEKARLEAEAAEKARLEAEEKARQEAERARLEAEKKAREEAERTRLEAEEKARLEAERARQKEEEEKVRLEVEKAREEAERVKEESSTDVNEIEPDSEILEKDEVIQNRETQHVYYEEHEEIQNENVDQTVQNEIPLENSTEEIEETNEILENIVLDENVPELDINSSENRLVEDISESSNVVKEEEVDEREQNGVEDFDELLNEEQPTKRDEDNNIIDSIISESGQYEDEIESINDNER